MPDILSLDVNQMAILSFLLFLLSIILFFVKKIKITRKDVLKMFFCFVLLLCISSFLPTKSFSGMGIMYHYGLPHFVYSSWKSFDKTSTLTSFYTEYFVVNFFFYLSFVLCVCSILKKTKKEKLNKNS